MQNHNDTIKTSNTVVRKIYFSLYWKRPNRNATYWTPDSIGHNRICFPFSWAAQPGAWEHTLLCAGFLYRILSPTGLVSKLIWYLTATAQSGAWGPTLLGVGFLYSIFSPTDLVSKLTDFLSSPSYIIVQRPTSCGRRKLHSFNPSMFRVIISWSTGFTCYLQRCSSYFDSPAGS